MRSWASRLLPLSLAAALPVGIWAMLSDRSWAHLSFGPAVVKALAGQIAIAAAVLVLEMVFVGWKDSSARSFLTTRSSRSDAISFLVIFSGLGAVLGVALGLGLAWHAGQVIGNTLHLNLVRLVPNAPAQITLGFIWLSFVGYVVHFFEHHVQVFWESHKQHHSAEEFSVLTAYRYAPISFVGVFTGIPAGIVGAPLESVFAIALFQQFHIFLIHSRLRWTFGPIGRWLFVSPNYHRLHHSADPAHFNANFGVDLVIWDRLFGTYRDPRTEVVAIGVPGEPQSGYLQDSIRSTYRAYAVLVTELLASAQGVARFMLKRIRPFLPG